MRRTLWCVPAAVVLLAAAWGLGLDLPLVGVRSAPGLAGVDWRLAAFEEDGRRWEVPGRVEATVQFESRSYDAHVCQFSGGGMVVHRATLALSPGLTTANGCGEDENRASSLFWRVLDADPGWSVADGVLTLTGNGVTAELRPRAPFPSGPRDFGRWTGSTAAVPEQWQLGTVVDGEAVSLRWEHRWGPDRPWVTHTFPAGTLGPGGSARPAPGARVVANGDRLLLVAVAAADLAGAARYEEPSGAVVALQGNSSGMFFGFVAAPGGTVVVSGWKGEEVARLRTDGP